MFNIVFEFNGSGDELIEILRGAGVVGDNCYDESANAYHFSEWVKREILSEDIHNEGKKLLKENKLGNIDFEIYYSVEKFQGNYVYRFNNSIICAGEGIDHEELKNVDVKDISISVMIKNLYDKFNKLNMKPLLIT
ncbi:hypothetical protein [Priestia aryabhattai]|uniref:hypothetical protein n=1 Tax=Priestia aryabhattai TaxID=412384 RepID=UPI0015F7647E|nr:hypothetical protein [Priestia aryabhattai]